MGVKGFHEIPVDVVAGQIEAVATDIGIQAAKTGMLASSDIIDAVADTWRCAGPGRRGAAGRRSGLRLDARRPAAAPERAGFASHRTVSAGNAGDAEPRRGARCSSTSRWSTTRPSAMRPAPCTRSARSGRWSRAGICGRRRRAPTCCTTAPTSTSSTRTASTPADDHGAGDTLGAAAASALAHGYTVPDAVAFAKRWVTECLRAAYPLGHGHGPVSPLFRLSESRDPRRHRGRRARARRRADRVPSC